MPSATTFNIDDYESLLVALQSTLGVVVPDSQRSNMLARIEPLLAGYQLDSLADLARKIQGAQADEIKSRILDVISLPRPGWCLTAELKKVLHEYIFAQLPDKACIWIVGCGQGQLAYAIAMEMAEFEHQSGKTKDLQFFASDVSLNDIKLAESGVYDAQQLAGVSDDHKKLYFTVNDAGKSYRIKDKIRQLISFNQCDLTEDFQPLGKMDLIICPEALVYFSNGVKAGILQRFSAQLKSGGIFLTGNNQSIIKQALSSQGESLERVEHPAGVFYRKKG